MKQLDVQRGFSLLEILAALALAALMMTSLTAMVDVSLQDTKSQQVAKYQELFTSAATRYINDNAVTLYSSTGTASQAITHAILTAGGYLPAGFAPTNSYQQTPCVLIRRHASPAGSPNAIDALVVTEGGLPIPPKDLGYVAANASTGGGVIDFGIPVVPALVAHGTAWLLDNATLSGFTSASCSGTAAGNGHLASAIFYGGPNGINRDVLYRSATTDPALNTMNTPLGMAGGAINQVAGQPCGTTAAIALDLNRNILSCGAGGVWNAPSSWKEPVANFAALGALTLPPKDGDVHMTLDNGHAYMFKAGAWLALALDQNNNFTVPVGGNINIAGGNLTVAGNAGVTGNATLGTALVTGKLDANNINTTLDVVAGQDIRVARDLAVTRNITAGNNIDAIGNVNAQNNVTAKFALVGTSVTSGTKTVGGACNFFGPAFGGGTVVYMSAGTVVTDSSGRIMECRPIGGPGSGGTFIYVDGTSPVPP